MTLAVCLVAAAFGAVGTVVGHVPTVVAPTDQAADALLARARAAIGGDARLNAVVGLDVEWTDTRPPDVAVVVRRGFSLLPPERYQSRLDGRTFTIDGDDYWQDPPIVSAMRDRAERNARRGFLGRAIRYLLMAPDRLGLTIEARTGVAVPLGDRTADVLTYLGADGYRLDLFLDPSTAHPLAFSSPFVTDIPGAPHIAMMEDYRVVEGVRFPFRVEERYGPDYRYHTVSTVTALRVNPPGLAERFVRR